MKIIFYILSLFVVFLWVNEMVIASDEVGKIIISEIMPNPLGDDTKLEWIEIQNTSANPINLAKWKLNGISLPDFEISSNEIILLTRDKSSIISSNRMVDFTFNLVNSGGTLTLLNTETTSESKFDYVQSVEGRSFELLSGDCLTISIHDLNHTMGLANTSCDAIVGPTVTPYPTVIYYTTYNYQDLLISAILPYPSAGSEWVEIINNSQAEINLSGWVLSDESSKTYQFPELSLSTGAKTRIFPANLSLNNDGDTINLYDPLHKLIDSFRYGKVIKDQVVSVTGVISKDDENITTKEVDNFNTISPEVKSINTGENKKLLNEILKKPIFYKLEDYVKPEG